MSIISQTQKLWAVVYGEGAPVGEINNAQKIAEYIRSLGVLNVARKIPAEALALDLLARTVNLVVVGGPMANEWTVKLNEYVNPKWDLVIRRERLPGETWRDYAHDAIEERGYLLNGTLYPAEKGTGIMGVGLPYVRVRELKAVFVCGNTFEDTCTVGLAFRDGASAGIYNCVNTPVPDMSECPENMSYTRIAGP